MLKPLLAHPRLLGAASAGVATAAALWLAPNPFSVSTRAVFAWDVTLLVFIVSALLMMRECDETRIRRRAAREDEGRHAVLIVTILAAFASILAIAAELSQAKSEHGLAQGLRVALAFGTVLGSWAFIHIVFALHYAHVFFSAGPDDGRTGGLDFPGGELPDYWDFLHFSTVIGVAAQTADIAFVSKRLRRIGTLHGIVAFTFNTVVVALTINMLAGLI